MPDKTYKLVELVGVSENSVQDAIRNAVARASQSLKGVDWFEMQEVRGLVVKPSTARSGRVFHDPRQWVFGMTGCPAAASAIAWSLSAGTAPLTPTAPTMRPSSTIGTAPLPKLNS